ncbi:hypothetical protein V8B55DRAFT_1456539 [Mucor lusitanicus]
MALHNACDKTDSCFGIDGKNATWHPTSPSLSCALSARFGVGLAIIIMCKFYFMQKSGATLDEAQTIIVFPLLQDVQVERMISQGR